MSTLSMPGVMASYWRDGDRFQLRGTNAKSNAEKQWWKAHGQQLGDTMTRRTAPT